jgi:cellulose synthase/poly-beta-1,6-N-acetylglucosamine synthase-like glycosyltransferase
MTTWFLVLAAVCFAAALHPFLSYPLSLRVLADWRTRPIRQGAPPSRVAVCVCAYNEAAVIAARVENILAQRIDFPDLDVLIYVDAATDGTAAILRGYGDEIRLVVSGSRHGKTYGMNTLVAMTRADIVVFSDANVLFAPGAVRRLVAPFADPAVGCACGHLRYTAPQGATAATGSLYWRLEEHIKSLESATGSVMGADGSIFAIRRRLHRPPPADLIDDMFVSFSVLCDGGRIVRADDAVAFEEAVSRPGEEFRRKVRIACQAFNVHRALWPRLKALPALDRYKYVSHKLLRWMVIYLLAAGAACVLGGLALIGAPLLAAALFIVSALALAVVMRAKGGPLATLRGVLEAFIATGLGVFRSLRGDRFQTWNPPASARAPLGAPTALPQ